MKKETKEKSQDKFKCPNFHLMRKECLNCTDIGNCKLEKSTEIEK